MYVIENKTRNGTAQDAGERDADQYEGNGLCLFALAEPITQVENHAGEISCFGEAQRKAGGIELMGGLHKARQRRNDAPCDEDARDPDARADAVKDEVAGDLKQEVAPKENSSRKSKLLAADGQFPIHRQSRKAQVDSVDESDDVERKQERQKPNLDFTDGSGLLQARNSAKAADHYSPSREAVRCFVRQLNWE